MWKSVFRVFDPSTSKPAPSPVTDDPTTTDEGEEKVSSATDGDGVVDSSDAPSTTPSPSASSVPPVFTLPSNALHLYHEIEGPEDQGIVPLPHPEQPSLTGPEEVYPANTMLEATASSTPKSDEDRAAALVAVAIHGTFMPSSTIKTNETSAQSTSALVVDVSSTTSPPRCPPSYIDENTLKTMFGLARMIVAATSHSEDTREQRQEVRDETDNSFSSSSSSFPLIGLHGSAQPFSEGCPQQETLRDASPGVAGVQGKESEEIKLDPDLESVVQVLAHIQDARPQHVSERALSPFPFFRIIEDGEFEFDEMSLSAASCEAAKPHTFKHFKAYAENQLNLKIKATRDDKGGEYMPREWDQFCNSEGIHRQHTIRAEPHQNGVAERANRTLVEGITTMLNEAHLPATFWWDAVAAFVHVHNRSPTSAVQGKTPFECEVWQPHNLQQTKT
ncbi:hypothetical protein EW145_g5775 [Phellinidium pouzarii]|uniref:Integrase catalytic domain-containing protein n=1 Tax=Phellinidium pouzarii TaxID=167371 RepID=A0A4S4KYV8_9AGAM|nr:hypothetical protein EW145_g5775 [Phellinidium pouzarii]